MSAALPVVTTKRLKTSIAVFVGCLVASILADIGYRGSLWATSPRSPSAATGEIYPASYRGATFYVTADQKRWMPFPEYGAELSLLGVVLTTYAYNRRRLR